MHRKERLLSKQRIVIKVGTTTISHEETGNLHLDKLERFVRILTDLRGSGREVIVVSSGAVGAGRTALGLSKRPDNLALKQACAAVGQGRLMLIYEKFFNEYSQTTAQILLSKESITNKDCRINAKNTFEELLRLGVIPIVNENDAISVDELAYGSFGDNDTLAANVTELVGADLLILLSDIDGMYTADPKLDPHAQLIHTVSEIDENLEKMAGGSLGDFGTGGMGTKVRAAKIATQAGADMIIANGANIDLLHNIIAGEEVGTLFLAANLEKRS